ncbi:hypothetical protein IW262DRAFT_1299322 [Armillaria fumosa]|nr:hypothetical protein IW262DRAFT_1299322 [Armillaria fumosa]
MIANGNANFLASATDVHSVDLSLMPQVTQVDIVGSGIEGRSYKSILFSVQSDAALVAYENKVERKFCNELKDLSPWWKLSPVPVYNVKGEKIPPGTPQEKSLSRSLVKLIFMVKHNYIASTKIDSFSVHMITMVIPPALPTTSPSLARHDTDSGSNLTGAPITPSITSTAEGRSPSPTITSLDMQKTTDVLTNAPTVIPETVISPVSNPIITTSSPNVHKSTLKLTETGMTKKTAETVVSLSLANNAVVTSNPLLINIPTSRLTKITEDEKPPGTLHVDPHMTSVGPIVNAVMNLETPAGRKHNT